MGDLRIGETGCDGLSEHFGRGTGIGCVSVLMFMVHLLGICLITIATNMGLQYLGAMDDLQTRVFAFIITIGLYNLYMLQCQTIDNIARGVGRDLLDKRINQKLDMLGNSAETIIALTDDLADDQENPTE